MTIPGGTARASNPKALMKDKQSHGTGDGTLKKGGEGAHNWGSAASELQDEIDGQNDAAEDARGAIAEGDEHPAGQTFEDRARLPATEGQEKTGSLSDEYADREGSYLARSNNNPNDLDLNEIARTSNAASFPKGDTVSSGAQATIEQSADNIARGKGTDGGFGAPSDSDEIVRDLYTRNR